MARIRSVHPDLCASKVMASLPPGLERTFVRLWTYLDDEGRGIDDPRLIKAAIYPQHDRQTWHVVDAELTHLVTHDLIWRYSVDDTCYLCVKPASWSYYQHPQKPRASTFPPPGGWVRDDTRMTPVRHPPGTRPVGVAVEGDVVVEGDVDVGLTGQREFDECWRHYPRKIRRSEALKGYLARRKAGASPDELLTATRHYALEREGQDPKFTMLGPTFYGPNDRWQDYLAAPNLKPYVEDRLRTMRQGMGFDRPQSQSIDVPALREATQ